ncbi:MAG: STAS/SEC14 domain-containing protein [Rubripirellula sp.]|nr:STAS/SEC14 domain-containing protein [Rubripirellula sp.]
MLDVQLLEDESMVILQPDGELSESDFAAAAERIDPFIERTGGLRGILIHVESFPGWDSFAAMTTHLQFIKEHHKQVAKIALVTDSPIGAFAETVVGHFICAEVKHFPFADVADAKRWIQQLDA